MGPKKKAKASSSHNTQQTKKQTRSVSRETSAEPQHQTRSTRKRRHSDTSNISEQPSDTQSPSKRRKRGKTTAEAEAEHERLQEVIEEEEEEPAVTTEAAASAETVDTVQVVFSKHVHFGAGDARDEILLPSDDLEATASHLTPDPRKMAIKRRLTASPVAGCDESKRLKRTSVRRSLPPSLSQQGSSQLRIVEEHEFAPLSEVLQERIQERRLKHARISALNDDLADARLKKDIRRIKELEDEIGELKEQHAALIAYGSSDVVISTDEDMLVLASQEEVHYPESPQLQSGDSQLRLSQVQSQEEVLQLERKQLEDAVLVFSNQAADAQAKLELLRIQVRGLSGADQDVDAEVVLQTIHESFAVIRDTLKEVLLDVAPQYATNQDLLSLVVDLLQDWASRVRDQDQELEKRSSLAGELGKQVQGLIDRLADSEVKREDLKTKFKAMDVANDEKEREIEDLQEELDAVANERDTFQDDLEVNTNEKKELEDENIEFAKNIDRLTASLQRYREEETRLQNLITKMQEEHETGVVNMNREREEAVRELENDLDEQSQLRMKAEEQDVARQALITALELKAEEVQTEQNRLRDELAAMTVLRDQEQDAREVAETDLDERTNEVTELEQRVTQLEDDLGTLNAQLDELRQTSETERAQREAACSELESTNTELDKVNKKLAAQGKHANELRQKLYEVQQQHEQNVRELEQASSERDEQFQNDIAHEVQRRENAEELTQERDITIDELNVKLEQVEGEMQQLLAERDEHIEALDEELAERDERTETLRRDFENTQTLHNAHAEQATEHRQQLEASIASLRDIITAHEEHINSMRNEATRMVEKHNAEMEDRDMQLAELNHSIADYEVQVTELMREKAGLERRVEQEAEQMLQYQNEKQDEIDSLKATIRDKQAKIRNVEEKAIAADQRWQEFVDARDEELALLREAGEEKTEIIAAVTADAESVRRKLREYVLKTNSKMKGLRDENAAFKARLERDGAELEEDGADVLREVDAMSVFQHTTVITTTSKHTQEVAQRNAPGRKKRVVDSGIGIDGESMLAE